MPDDELIDRLGELSQTPITHRKSGKPGRGSASRERDPPRRPAPPCWPRCARPVLRVRCSSGPVLPSGPSHPVRSGRLLFRLPGVLRPFGSFSLRRVLRSVVSSGRSASAATSFDDDDDEPRRFRPVLAVRRGRAYWCSWSGSCPWCCSAAPARPHPRRTPVGASDPRSTTSSPGRPVSTAAVRRADADAVGPPRRPRRSRRRPRRRAPADHDHPVTTTEPPPIPGVAACPSRPEHLRQHLGGRPDLGDRHRDAERHLRVRPHRSASSRPTPPWRTVPVLRDGHGQQHHRDLPR